MAKQECGVMVRSTEPVLLLALVEDEFQAADANCHQAETHSVDGIALALFLYQLREDLHHPVC